MSDLPMNGLLQQLSAKDVSGEHLEVLGKNAASMWADGRVKTLNDAVVATVKHAGLSPEQVKRVVEFTNTDAYLREFRKEGSAHKVIDFGTGGPASPSVVLQDLNDGGGGSVFDPGTGDYHQPPRSKVASARGAGALEKTASAGDDRAEQAFAAMFGAVDAPLPAAEPLSHTLELRDKLAQAFDTSTSQITMLEGMFDELVGRCFHNVKQASLSGHALSEVVQIWQDVAPSEEHVKIAFTALIPRLVDNGVFPTGEAVAESLQKVASVGVVNEEHPLVSDFKDFCETLSKLAETRDEQVEVGEGLAQVNFFLKSAASDKGLLLKGLGALDRAGNFAGKAGERAGEVLLGAGKGKAVGTAARVGTKYVLPAVGAHEVYRRTLKHNPGFQAVKQTALGAIPGTEEYNQKEYELALRGQGMGGMMGGGY